MSLPTQASFRRQRGVSLIIAMIVLIVIGLTSAAVMRGALVSDQVANNTRSQTLASEAADVALRYCERQLSAAGCTAAVTCLAAPAAAASAAWEKADTWYTGGATGASVNVVPSTVVNSAGIKTAAGTTLFSNDTLPQCVVEVSPLGATTYVVTARGFSPDHQMDGSGRTKSGSSVWVQSTVKF